MLTRTRLESLLAAFPRLTIGLLGDLFLDRYLEIEPGITEISIETGLEAYQIPRIRNSPGALGTVMNNLAALGVGTLVPVTVIGDDGQGYDLLKQLRQLPVDTTHVLQVEDRLTPTYTKPLRQNAAGVWAELNRLDLRTRAPLSPSTLDLLHRHLRDVFWRVDGLIVLDQVNEENWGVVGTVVRAWLPELVRAQSAKLLFVDSRKHLGRFDCGSLKGNRAEFASAAALQSQAANEGSVEAMAAALADKTGRPAFCTVGDEGIVVAEPRSAPVKVPAYPVPGPLDIVGAGDSATAGIVASLLAGASPVEAAAIGNLVASITVQQLGTTGTARPAQVIARWQEHHG